LPQYSARPGKRNAIGIKPKTPCPVMLVRGEAPKVYGFQIIYSKKPDVRLGTVRGEGYPAIAVQDSLDLVRK